jgi:inorganic pyrophosphatase
VPSLSPEAAFSIMYERGAREGGCWDAHGEEGGVDMDEDLWVIVEIPKGSRNKYEWDEERGAFRLDRMLFSSVHYPADYGFIVDTLGEDGDAVDALVMVGEATFPGCHINVKPIGLFKMWDEKGLDHKVLCVPVGDPNWSWVEKVEDLPEHLLLEIEHFFAIYKDLEMKKTRVGGWEGVKTAQRVITEGRERWAAVRA